MFRQRDEIAESVEVPASGHFFNDGKEAPGLALPDYYRPHDLSGDSPLTLTDCHLAMLTAIRKARLIGFQIARRNKPVFKRTSREITLQGDPREFDIILSSINNEYKDTFRIGSIETLRDGPEVRLTDVLKNPLVAHKDFEDSSGTYHLIFKGY